MARLTNETINITNTFSNTNVSIIKITEDKLVNILTLHVEKLKKSKQWLASLSFSISLFLVLLTSTFRSMWGLSGEQWQMLFIVLFIGSVAYFLCSVYNCFKHKVTVDIIVDEIKNEQE